MNLRDRVTNILTKPQSEWAVIAAEPADVTSIYTSYILILAAIPAVSTIIGTMVIGVPLFGSYGPALALRAGIGSYVGAIIGAICAAFIIEKLAPTFSSQGDTAQALKLVAYANTPVWVAGVLHLVPLLGILVILAWIYAIYLFYLGVSPVMKTPSDKVVPYMIVSALVMIVVGIVIGVIMTALIGGSMMAGRMF
jgi:Yip1-like protein